MFPFNYSAAVPLPGQQPQQEQQDESDEEDPTVWNATNNKSLLQFHGNERTMNINPLILTNVQGSPYFKVELFAIKTFHEVVDQIYYKVDHLEPWATGSRKTAGRSQTGMCGGVRGVSAGGIVSSCYCLMYKLFTLKITKKQVVALINHVDSPYIRGVGFMFLRYTLPPSLMWDWFEPYLDDEEEIDIKAGGGKPMTIGELCRTMITRLEWFDTRFPRIAVNVEKQIRDQLEQRRQEQDQGWAEPTHRTGFQQNHLQPVQNRSSPSGGPSARGSREKSIEGKSSERSREGKSRNRSTSKDRRSRSRERGSRDRRSRSRDRKSRDRKSRDKSRDRKSRERSRDRRERSRSRDRKKKKDRSRSRERHQKKHKRDRSRERRRSRSRSRDSKHRSKDDDYSQELKKFREESSKIKKKSRRSRSRS